MRELGLRADVLMDVLVARGGFEFVPSAEAPPPKKLPFRNESAARIFLDEAMLLVTQRLHTPPENLVHYTEAIPY